MIEFPCLSFLENRQAIARWPSVFAYSLCVLLLLILADIGQGADKQAISLQVDTAHPGASFLPGEAFGAGLDGLEETELEQAYKPANIKAMAEAPYNRLTYRLRTELGVEAWHWNEEGSWSNPAKKEGYWVSNDRTDKPLLRSFGYRLPRRGNTIDQAVNDGYSRLDDGDPKTFWKSNPYLDTHFTGEANDLHPQWVLIDLGRRLPLDAIRILWADPYATRYQVQYWDGESSEYLNRLHQGQWRPFTGGIVENGKGGDTLLQLNPTPVSAQYIRILLQASSGTGPKSEDVRDRLGYAIREIFLGRLDRNSALRDIIKHSPTNRQTNMVVSSTDPWHRASDRNPGTAQPGFDRIVASGLGRGKPILIPIPVLYDTPDNAASEIRFLKARGVPVQQIELGEEADGQIVQPEHYGALYVQFANAVHAVNPNLVTGGPSLQSEVNGWEAIIDPQGEYSWMKRFLHYLRTHQHLGDFGFFSFEWYPFDDVCGNPAKQLLEHSTMLPDTFARLEKEGVPRSIPWIISEYGYSSFAGRVEVELPAALLNAEIVAQFLLLGGKTAYYYGLEPKTPIRELNCTPKDRVWGDLMMFQAGEDGIVKWKMPAYHGLKMLVEEWAQPVDGPHRMFPVKVTQGDKACSVVAGYALQRPDQRWALLLLNKGNEPLTINRLGLGSPPDHSGQENESIEVVQYSAKQYVWHPEGENGYPLRSQPPARFGAPKNGDSIAVALPPMSLSVLRSSAPIAWKNGQTTE